MAEKTNLKNTKWGHFDLLTASAISETCFQRALAEQKDHFDSFMRENFTGKISNFCTINGSKIRLAPGEVRHRYARRGGPVGVFMTLIGSTTMKRDIDDIVKKARNIIASLMIYRFHRKYPYWQWDSSPGAMFCDYLAMYTNSQWDIFALLGLCQWLSVAIPHHVFCVYIPIHKQKPLYLKNGRWMRYFVGNNYRINLPDYLIGEDMFMYTDKEKYMMLADYMGDSFYRMLLKERDYDLSGKLTAIECFCCSPERIAKALVVRNLGARFVRDPLTIFSTEGEQDILLEWGELE